MYRCLLNVGARLKFARGCRKSNKITAKKVLLCVQASRLVEEEGHILNDPEPVVLPSQLLVPANRCAIHDAVNIGALQQLVFAWRG